MTEQDQRRWDARYSATRRAASDAPGPPGAFANLTHHFPTRGTAVDIACGAGEGSVWLAMRGLDVWGVDVSPNAIGQARALAASCEVSDRGRFDVADLDDGLPTGPPVDVILCHRFRDPRLYPSMTERLAAGGLLAIAVLSEVGPEPGRFRAPTGELTEAFDGLTILAHDEAEGTAMMLGTKPVRADTTGRDRQRTNR